jgi:hypothetical protein
LPPKEARQHIPKRQEAQFFSWRCAAERRGGWDFWKFGVPKCIPCMVPSYSQCFYILFTKYSPISNRFTIAAHFIPYVSQKSFSCKVCILPKGEYYIMSTFSLQKFLITLTSLGPVDMFYFKESAELGVLFF